MSAERPVSAAHVTPADVMVEAFQGGLFVHFGEGCEHGTAGVAWAECCVRAGLEAVVPLIRAQVEAELRASATFNAQVRDALRKLDGTTASAVALLTGMTRDEINQVGGVADEDGHEARQREER